MGLFDKLTGKGKKSSEQSAYASLSNYSGMRVEVFDQENTMLFTAKFIVTAGGECRLQQLTETDMPQELEPKAVSLRGYYAEQKVAVHMTGIITWVAEDTWLADRVRVESKSNDRAFYRQGVDVTGDIRAVGKDRDEKTPCHVVNISAGGACVQTEADLPVEGMCILNFRLSNDVTLPPMPSEIRRKTKCKAGWEYGCRFLDLNATIEDQIAKTIMHMQMAKRRM